MKSCSRDFSQAKGLHYLLTAERNIYSDNSDTVFFAQINVETGSSAIFNAGSGEMAAPSQKYSSVRRKIIKFKTTGETRWNSVCKMAILEAL